jgi:hypothetical protein
MKRSAFQWSVLALFLLAVARPLSAAEEPSRMETPPSSSTADLPPVAALSGPATVVIGQLATYDATRSGDDRFPNAALTFRYQWGDGSDDVVGKGLEWQTHAYLTPSIYEVRVTVTDPSDQSVTAVHTVNVVVPIDYGEICLSSTRHSAFDGFDAWSQWFLQHPNDDEGRACTSAAGYAPDRSWDTDTLDVNIGLMPHNSIGVSPPINSLSHGTAVEVQVDVMLNTEYDYQEGGEGGYGLRNCGGGHLVNLTTDGRSLTCREDPCPGICCPGDCVEHTDDTQRFELDQVKNRGFRIVSWHPGLGPSNQTNDATVSGLNWTAGKWLRFKWKVELLAGDSLNNVVRHTVTYLSVDGVPLPQPEFTVERTITFNQPVEWRPIHFLSFGNFDLCPGRRQEPTSDDDNRGCEGPYLGRMHIRNLYVRDIQ